MRFVIYKNSVLATVCSLVGAVAMAMGVIGLFQGDISILPAIAVIAVGVGLTWLAMVISDKKEQKKHGKPKPALKPTGTAASRPVANPGVSNPGTAQSAPQRFHPQPTNPAYPYRQPAAAPVGSGKQANVSLMIAGIFFLFAMVLGFISLYLLKKSTPVFIVNAERIALYVACPLLAIAAFLTRKTQKVSILFVIGFMLLTLVNAYLTYTAYLVFGFGEYIAADGSTYYAMTSFRMLKTSAYLLMTVLALLSMPMGKNKFGGIVKWLWYIPVPILLLVYGKEIADSYIPAMIAQALEYGIMLPLRHDLLDIAARFWLIPAMFFSCFAFWRLCRKTDNYAQPKPQFVSPAPRQAVNPAVCPHCGRMNNASSLFCCHCGQRVAQPQSVGQAAAEPVQQSQPAPAAHAPKVPEHVQKEMEAYKDLLDCGILTQEQYDQKIRDLTGG